MANQRPRYFRPRGLSPAAQFLALRSSSLCRGTGALGQRGLVWDCLIRPTPLSREYAVHIAFREGRNPKVWVCAPNLLELSNGRTIPHTYRREEKGGHRTVDGTQLCLYLPAADEWTPRKLIAATIIPWIYLWLFYFEDWLFSGEWTGGGVHPN